MLPEYLPWYHPSRKNDCSITKTRLQETYYRFFKNYARGLQNPPFSAKSLSKTQKL